MMKLISSFAHHEIVLEVKNYVHGVINLNNSKKILIMSLLMFF